MNKRRFTAKEIEKLKDKYPAVLRLKCRCPKRHRSGCGCMTEMFVKVARKNFSRALHDAGTDSEKFKKRMTALHHHARDIHVWVARIDFWLEKCVSVRCQLFLGVECCATFQAALYIETHSMMHQSKFDAANVALSRAADKRK